MAFFIGLPSHIDSQSPLARGWRNDLYYTEEGRRLRDQALRVSSRGRGPTQPGPEGDEPPAPGKTIGGGSSPPSPGKGAPPPLTIQQIMEGYRDFRFDANEAIRQLVAACLTTADAQGLLEDTGRVVFPQTTGVAPRGAGTTLRVSLGAGLSSIKIEGLPHRAAVLPGPSSAASSTLLTVRTK